MKTNATVTRWLVRRGARVNHSNVWGETALHTAMRRPGEESEERLQLVRYLLKHEARVICCDDNNLTPLMLAAGKGFKRICEVLITHASVGASYDRVVDHVNLRAEDGATALMMASQAGRLDCVSTLLGFGADADLAAEDGTLAAHLACIAPRHSAAILEQLLPRTSLAALELACNIRPPDPVPRHHDKKVLSPYKLAMEWENWDSLDILAKFLPPHRFSFYTPLQFCFLHKDLCPDDSGFCDAFPYRCQNPLSSLLSESLSEKSVSKLSLFTSLIPDPRSLPPLVTLLTSSSQDIHSDPFRPESLAGRAFSFLAERGAAVAEEDLLPVLLFSSVSGLVRLLRSGLVPPPQLVSGRQLARTRQLLASCGGGGGRVLELPLVTQRLLSLGILATHCAMLEPGWVQTLALLVLDQLKRILNIDNLVVIDKMYRSLRVPRTLQQLTRVQVHKNLRDVPSIALEKLPLPKQIKSYLMFSDINVDDMIKDYKDTIDYINDNGQSNIIHI